MIYVLNQMLVVMCPRPGEEMRLVVDRFGNIVGQMSREQLADFIADGKARELTTSAPVFALD